MIIVYLSLVLIGVAIIWFLFQLVSSIKGIRDSIIHMGKKVEKIREKTEDAKKEQVAAVQNIQELEKVVHTSMDQVTFATGQGKELLETFNESQEAFKKTFSFFPIRRGKAL